MLVGVLHPKNSVFAGPLLVGNRMVRDCGRVLEPKNKTDVRACVFGTDR